MKQINAIALLLAGLVATTAISYMIFTGFQELANIWLLIMLWLVAAAIGIFIADNAIKIDRGMRSQPNLTKIVYLPVIGVTFALFVFSGNLLPLLITLVAGSFGLCYSGYLLFRSTSI